MELFALISGEAIFPNVGLDKDFNTSGFKTLEPFNEQIFSKFTA